MTSSIKRFSSGHISGSTTPNVCRRSREDCVADGPDLERSDGLQVLQFQQHGLAAGAAPQAMSGETSAKPCRRVRAASICAIAWVLLRRASRVVLRRRSASPRAGA
jgi:hypothetical protein